MPNLELSFLLAHWSLDGNIDKTCSGSQFLKFSDPAIKHLMPGDYSKVWCTHKPIRVHTSFLLPEQLYWAYIVIKNCQIYNLQGWCWKGFFYLSSCLIMQWISFILIFVSFLLWQVLWILWLQEHCVTITKCKMEIFPKKGYPVSSLPARRKSIFMIERRQLLASQSNVSKGVNCHSAGGQISV